MKKISILLLLIISFSMASCSWVGFGDRSSRVRSLANPVGEIEHLLGIDRFHYYINEFAGFQEGKLDDEVIEALRKIKPQDLIAEGYSLQSLKKAQNYDLMIYKYLTRYYPDLNTPKAKVKWEYNFLKNKLNEGFSLRPTKLEEILYHDDFVVPGDAAEKLTLTNVNPETQTLESGHYISNRTTRAAFWDAVAKDRKVEFHLGDSREFLKNLSANKGEILYEIKPLARNYNKIFLVKYPGDSSYRVAITNIGGADRLEHMVHHLSLSKLTAKTLKNKVTVYGGLEEFHERLFKKLKGQMKHLPKADRVVIGQKGAVEGIFNLHLKLEGMRAYYKKSKAALKTKIGAENFSDLEDILKGDDTDFDIVAIKKKVETSYEKVKTIIEKDPTLKPASFRKYSADNTTTEMADYVFKNKAGKDVRWRVVGNVWGDEIVPLAKALKETGHTNVTYMGTTGAFAGKGYEVGDLVIPSHARDLKGKVKFKGTAMNIPGAKVGGVVEHVASPFNETEAWLQKTRTKADLVEIETNYLARIFNGANDHMRAYLLVSDIVGAEGETLAHASSSKRKKSLNSLLGSLFKRDKAAAPTVVADKMDTKVEKLRAAIDELFGSKGATLRYYIFSHFKDQELPDKEALQAFEQSFSNFSDNYFTKRLVSSSEALSNIMRVISEEDAMPKIGLNKEFVEGKWHPKNDQVKIQIYASSQAQEERFKAVLNRFSDMTDDVDSYSSFEVIRGPPPAGMVTVKAEGVVDQDFLVKVYAEAGFRQAGLDYEITYNGNIKYHFLPTEKQSKVCDAAKKFCSLAYFSPDSQTRELLDRLASIPGINPKQKMKEFVTQMDGRLKAYNGDFKGTVKMSTVSSLPGGDLAQIVPEFSKTKGLVVNLKITQEGLNNPMVVLEEMAHLKQICENYDAYFGNPLLWAEVSKNAEFGSVRSQVFLAKAEIDAMDVVTNDLLEDFGLTDNEDVTSYIQKRRAHATKQVSELKKLEKIEKKSRNAMAKQWNTLQKQMQDANLKLDDYIAQGNRKKVVEMINTFMPWEDMEPTEIAAWQKWLKAMEKPTKLKKNKVLVFRGLEGDLVREGAKEGEHFLMAKMLTKNQGNYTRRLRSLKTHRTKMVKKVNVKVPTDVPSIASIMQAHSHEPNGSPFLSASNLSTARSFSGNQGEYNMAAMFIDKDRFMTNAISTYGEQERMIPLIVFPDEIIVMGKSSADSGVYGGFDESAFLAKVKQKIGRNITASEKSSSGWDKLRPTQEWWDSINPKGVTPAKSPTSCKKIIQLFLGNL
jgi:hypothetical protein